MQKQDRITIKESLDEKVMHLDGVAPYPVSATPFVMTQFEYDELAGHSENVLSAINKVVCEFYRNERLRKEYPEHAEYLHILENVPEWHRQVHFARFDLAYLGPNQFKMVEPNAACPGSFTTAGTLNNAFYRTGFYRDNFGQIGHRPQVIDDEKFLANYLVELFQKHRHTSDIPTVGLISSRHRKLITDLKKFEKICEGMGIPVVHCDVQDLEYRDGQVFYEDTKLDACYLKFVVAILENAAADLGIYDNDLRGEGAFVRALNDGAVIYMNSYASIMLAENKRVMSFLFDNELRKLFSASECSSIDKIVARTTHFTDSDGKGALWSRSQVLEEKDKFVIKGVHDTRGNGVFLGKNTSPEVWSELVDQLAKAPLIVQEFLVLAQESVLKTDVNEEGTFDAYTDIGLYMLGGKAAGFFCRASKKEIVNVGAGGALRPTIIAG